MKKRKFQIMLDFMLAFPSKVCPLLKKRDVMFSTYPSLLRRLVIQYLKSALTEYRKVITIHAGHGLTKLDIDK